MTLPARIEANLVILHLLKTKLHLFCFLQSSHRSDGSGHFSSSGSLGGIIIGVISIFGTMRCQHHHPLNQGHHCHLNQNHSLPFYWCWEFYSSVVWWKEHQSFVTFSSSLFFIVSTNLLMAKSQKQISFAWMLVFFLLCALLFLCLTYKERREHELNPNLRGARTATLWIAPNVQVEENGDKHES